MATGAEAARPPGPLSPALPGPAEFGIVAPTFNERGDIDRLVARLDECLDGVAWEVIFVDDDSPDGTAAVVRDVAKRDHRVRCVQRLGRRGLSSAWVEGMLRVRPPTSP